MIARRVRKHHKSYVKLETRRGEHSRVILVDLGSPDSSGLLRPAECAEALEPQDSSFQLSSITSSTVAPEGVAGFNRLTHSALPGHCWKIGRLGVS